jgi:predicted RNase H-like HicB family nuclease
MAETQTAYIDLEFIVTKENNQYSSWCPDLDIASCGDNAEDAIRNLSDAIELYLNTLAEEGEREAVFKERGIKIVQSDEPVLPRSFVTQYRHRVNVSI